jgi:hypothetical protein
MKDMTSEISVIFSTYDSILCMHVEVCIHIYMCFSGKK